MGQQIIFQSIISIRSNKERSHCLAVHTRKCTNQKCSGAADPTFSLWPSSAYRRCRAHRETDRQSSDSTSCRHESKVITWLAVSQWWKTTATCLGSLGRSNAGQCFRLLSTHVPGCTVTNIPSLAIRNSLRFLSVHWEIQGGWVTGSAHGCWQETSEGQKRWNFL